MTVNNAMPTLTLNQAVQPTGIFNPGGPGIGTIRSFAYDINTNYEADGSTLPIGPNAAMFAIMGTQSGGDGNTSFGLPDLDGRLAVGAGTGTGTGLTPRPFASEFGSDEVTLQNANVPVSEGGQGTAVTNVQDSTAVKYIIATQGIFPSRSFEEGGDPKIDGAGLAQGFVSGDPFLGQIIAIADNAPVPPGWAAADGSLLAINSNSALFSILGTIYGGDGRTSFALPDLSGRVPVHYGQGPGLQNYRIGDMGGTETYTIQDGNLPDNGSTSIDNRQPFTAINFQIALQGVFPGFGQPAPDGQVALGEMIMFAGNFAIRGYAQADGQLLPIASNTSLYSLMGTQFGGDGRSTFQLPDLRGRAVVGNGDQGGNVGTRTGAEDIVLQTSDVPLPVNLDTTSGNDGLFGDDGDNTVTFTASEINPGDRFDGRGGTDTVQINGGGTLDFSAVALEDVEEIRTDNTNTNLTVTEDQARLIKSMGGANDNVTMTNYQWWGDLGNATNRTDATDLLLTLLANGAESVSWSEGGSTITARLNADGNLEMASTDTGGAAWTTSVMVVDPTTGNRISKTTTLDNGSRHEVTWAAGTDVLQSQTTTNIPGPANMHTIFYRADGTQERVETTYDAGNSLVTSYDASCNKTQTVSTAVNGAVVTTSFNAAGEITQIV